MMQGAMNAMSEDRAMVSAASVRDLDALKQLKEKTAAIVGEIKTINGMASSKAKVEAVERLYQEKIMNLDAPFVEKVNERRRQVSPWVEKLDELTKTKRGARWLYALRVAPILSRTVFGTLAKKYNVKGVSHMRDIYGIENKGAQWAVRLMEYGVMAAGIAGAFLTGYVIWPVLAAGMVMLPRLLFGRVNNSSERSLWVGIVAAHAWVMGLFAHHLFGKFATYPGAASVSGTPPYCWFYLRR